MSFKAELEALIANANSSLEDLEEVLRRAQARSRQGDNLEVSDGNVREIQTQIDTIRQRILSSLIEIRESYNHDQERLSDLEGELKLDLENVRQCAIDYFTKGEYRECERLLTFLAKVQPHDENLQNFLELSRRKQLEHEAERTSAAPDSAPHSEGRDREQPLAHENHPQLSETPRTNGRREEVERRGVAGAALPLTGAGEPEGPLPAFQVDPHEEPETIEPQILAEIELKTAAHIDEMYRTPPHSTKTGFLVVAGVVALGIAATFYWFSTLQPGSSVAETLSASQSRIEEELVSTKDPLAGLRQEAQELFDAGKFQEAGRVCEAILSKDPQDSFAVSLKDYVRASLAEPKTPATEAVPSERTAQLHQTSVQPPEARSDNVQVRGQPLTSSAPLPPALSTDPATLNLKRLDARVQKPSEQRSVGQQMTPANQAVSAPPSPALPIPASQVATVPQIRPDQLLELNNRIQARDFDQARLLLGQLESGFPKNPEVRALGEQLRLEVQKQNSLASSLIEKAEAAWIGGRYVTPPNDNVLVYCNLALKADPKNQRATNLKKEIVQRAVAQAKDWIQRGKFDAARLTYASMDYLAAGDEAFPYPKQDIKRELERLSFRNYTMVHDHKLGSCSGILKFNAYAVSYVPSGGSGDGFAENLDSIVLNDEGERLKITYRDKTFRFRSEKGSPVQTIYQQLMTRMSDEKSILATRSRDTP